MKERCRVLLADDHTLVRAGVRRILETEPDITVVGEAADGEAALRTLAETPVDVLVLDLTMPGRDGLAVLAEAKRLHPDLKVLVLTMHADPEYVSRAVQEGADGYLLKDSAVQDLVTAVEAVVEGRAYFSPSVQRELTRLARGEAASPSEPKLLDRLTEREREVLRAVAEGYSTKEIASRLEIGPRTVESHRAAVMRKLGLRSVARLTQIAIREGLIERP